MEISGFLGALLNPVPASISSKGWGYLVGEQNPKTWLGQHRQKFVGPHSFSTLVFDLFLKPTGCTPGPLHLWPLL